MTSAADLGVTLRQATDDDRPFLFRVYAHTRAQELAATGWSVEQKTAFAAQQFLAQDADYRARWPPETFQVVEVAGEPAGRLYVAERDGELRIIDIVLLPEWCGRGVGGALLRGLLDRARERGLTAVLHVEHWNPARRLYERLGFVETGREDVYARMEWSVS